MKENESGRGDPGRSRSPEGRERRITLVWIFLHGQFLSASQPGRTEHFSKHLMYRDNLFPDYHSRSGGRDSGQF